MRNFRSHHFWNKNFSKEHKDKISESMKGKHSGKNNPMFGKKVSDYYNLKAV